MEIEHGIATQRLRLLRLTAGLLLAVAFMSAAPFSGAYRHWLRGFIFSVLIRAEAAAQCLVIAQARVLARQNGVCFDPRHCLGALGQNPDEGLPTLAALRRRLTALRAVLNTLPRRGLRLLQRMSGGQSKRPTTNGLSGSTHRHSRLGAWRLASEPIERPPDKGFRQTV